MLKIKEKLFTCIVILFCLLYSLVLFSNIVIDKNIDYSLQTSNIVKNIYFFIVSNMFVFTIYFFYKKFYLNSFFEKIKIKNIHFLGFVFFVFIILFRLQLYISENIYFLTGWDVSVVMGMSDQIAQGNSLIGNNIYYSQYPNNILITYILMLIQKYSFIKGIDPIRYLICIRVDSFLLNISGLLTFLLIYKMTKCKIISILSLVPISFLIILSPWMLIPYTDTFSIIFPILILFIYLNRRDNISKVFSWFFIGFIGMTSYYMKPSCFIIIIAIIVIEFISHITNDNIFVFKKFYISPLSFIVGIIVSRLFYMYVCKILGCDLIENLNMPFTHFLMMGANNENGGAYISSDYAFSSNQPDVKTRFHENLTIFFERIYSYGFLGSIKFYIKKMLSTFNDGTFAWGNEGGFFQELKGKNTTEANFLRNIFFPNGIYFLHYKILVQGLWIFIQSLILYLLFFIKKIKDKETLVILLSLIGMFFYLLLFEMRARYLINFIPIYILIAFISLNLFISRLLKKSF